MNALSKTRLIGHKQSTKIIKLLDQWATRPIFTACHQEKVASSLIVMSLWHTYLFGRYTLPSWIGHLFLALRDLPPADEILSPVLVSALRLGEGELATTNVFQQVGDAPHAHYWDMRQAVIVAGVSYHAISSFERNERRQGIHRAMETSSLWSAAMRDYACLLEEVTRDPLTTFVIGLVSEDTIQRGYQEILRHLPSSETFLDYRTFLERHIVLDQVEHGPSTIAWVNHFLKRCTEQQIEMAMNNTIRFTEARIATYEL